MIIEREQTQINQYEAVSIHLASPNDIRSWSYGEVKKAETINYRSYRPERDGLFCERIFGPERDWECACGRYRGSKYKDTVCPRCGVVVTTSKVRRHRMGHINLASPVVHIWFFKNTPSRLALILDVKGGALQQVVYYQRYIVIDPGETKLKKCQTLSEEEYHEAVKQYGEGSFRTGMGGEAIKELLQAVDYDKLEAELNKQVRQTAGKAVSQHLLRRLKVVGMLRQSGNQPEWMVLDVIPVIPPDLRPLVPLESGNFATSDLNDLYRRVINRNNRLRKLLDLNAPSVIIRNEKRMLQQAVDALFDNSRCRRPILGAGNRPLRSLVDAIKGKQGRFRSNLLGKRVDYSGRSVIVVGPGLKLDQCGLPKKMALELFQPFIIRKLREKGYADTIKRARRLLEQQEKEVWDLLEEVVRDHVVMLNRAPTLHRMSIQAFYPVLVEGDSIWLHPLVCAGFNADFDGDQIAVHVPLSVEAQIEAKLLMLSSHNIFSPAHGNPVITPDRDIVLGCYYLTSEGHRPEKPRTFGCKEEVLLALDRNLIHLREVIRVRLGKEVAVVGPEGRHRNDTGVYETTAGRVTFNDSLPNGLDYYNIVMTKRQLGRVISDCHHRLARKDTVALLDAMKDLGFHYATVSGISFAATDLVPPASKEVIVAEAEKKARQVQQAYQHGLITEGERYNRIIDIWTSCREQVWDELMHALRNDEREGQPNYANPLFMMVDSGARGSVQQMGQLAGMRGLMAKPSGRVIEVPIRANFREGLRSFEYFSSTHGARKGLADTALKTAHSGYLTRKMIEVVQDVRVMMRDCGTLGGIAKGAVYKGEYVELSLAEAVVGRTARDTIVDPVTDEVIVRENELITLDRALRVEELKFDRIRVRSPLTCEAPRGVCAMCYGMDLSTGELVEDGLAVGIIAAQSVGEPGTQLTMRTFHVGGIGMTRLEESRVQAKHAGKIRFANLSTAANKQGKTVSLVRNGEIIIVDHRERELERHIIPVGAELKVQDRQEVQARTVLAVWDPHMVPILTEVEGRVRYEDIIEDETVRREVDTRTGIERKVVIEHKGDYHPQIVIEDQAGHPVGLYPMPEKAHLEVNEGDAVQRGDLLARTPREITSAQDITSGLARITELFEARHPRDAATISEMDGSVEIGERKRGRRTISVKGESGLVVEHAVAPGKHLLVHAGDRVKAGDRLVDGPLDPHDLLRVAGVEKTQKYLLDEVQMVYRSQNVNINDKHLELLISRMFQRIEVETAGGTHFLPTELVDRWEFQRVNREAREKGLEPATGKAQLQGIVRASLQGDSFLAAASFQETTRVLTDAALAGRIDCLHGLKENVILGHIIPAGSGYREYFTAIPGHGEELAEAAEERKQLEARSAGG